jgi:purine-nucleoside phosphorylase
MGVPSMGLYAYELYRYFGVDSIIRIGSAGGVADGVKLRDVVIAMGASTNSAYANQYCFPGILAPLASYPLVKYAAETAERIGARAIVGPVFTADQFYDANPDSASKYREMGILAVEMETAGLYLTAARAGKQALSILTVSDLVFTGEGLTADERQNSFTEMMEIALETAWKSVE